MSFAIIQVVMAKLNVATKRHLEDVNKSMKSFATRTAGHADVNEVIGANDRRW
jgi:hypothetical protein